MKKSALIMVMMFISSMSQAQVITAGTGTGPIPDNDTSGLTVTFPVTGLVYPIDSVSLSITINHTYTADLIIVLSAPNGIAKIVIMETTGARRSNPNYSFSDLDGIYVFNDLASGDWWQAATNGNSVIPPGEYRSSTRSSYNSALNDIASDFGGCTTRMDGAFKGLSANKGNGNWTLNVVDQFGSDLGSVTSAALTINQQSNTDLIFQNDFEDSQFADFSVLTASNTLGECKKARFDFTGNGLSDFTIVEDSGNGDVLWTVQDNDTTTVGAIQGFILGLAATDFYLDGDIDGDGIKDPIAWRNAPAGEAAFYVRRSSRPNDDVLKFVMGQTGDSPAQVGDYDGDGIEDFAVFRAPSTAGPTALIIHESSTGTLRSISMASGTASTIFSTSGFDHTGDGIADAVIQRTSPTNPGVGEHLIYDGSNGNLVNSFEFGLNFYRLAPGNYLGDNRADINLGHNINGDRNWFTRETGPGTEVGPTIFGVGNGFLLTGDYDGDGYDDYAVYNVNDFTFNIRPSSDPGTPIVVNLGSSGIYPVPNTRVQ